MELTKNIFLCLVCGQETIFALSIQEISRLIDLAALEIQYISVVTPLGRFIRVKGTAGTLETTLRHNSSPDKLFEELMLAVD